MTITEAVHLCIQATGLSAREITKVRSGEFALALLGMVGGDPGKEDPNCRLLFTEDVTDREDLPRHAWVFFRGKHFDAEAHDGVTDWLDLPVFRRAL